MGEVTTASKSRVRVFNSPLETALRLLFIFNKSNRTFDLQRLVYYNYLLIHSSDVPNAPKSIHADLPRRSCEMLVNRAVIKKALTVLISRGLIDVVYSKKGIEYRRNDATMLFSEYLKSSYSEKLRERSEWLSLEFDKRNDEELSRDVDANLGKWGSEFSVEYDDLAEDYA